MNTDRKKSIITSAMAFIAALCISGCSSNNDTSFDTTSSDVHTPAVTETYTHESEEYPETIEFAETYIETSSNDAIPDDKETSQTDGYIKGPVVILADGEIPDYVMPVTHYLNAVEYCDAAKFMQVYYCDTLLDYLYNRKIEEFSTYTEIFDFWIEHLNEIKGIYLEKGSNGELSYRITDSFELSETEKAQFVKNIAYLELPVPEFNRARYIQFNTFCGDAPVETRCAVELQIDGQWYFFAGIVPDNTYGILYSFDYEESTLHSDDSGKDDLANEIASQIYDYIINDVDFNSGTLAEVKSLTVTKDHIRVSTENGSAELQWEITDSKASDFDVSFIGSMPLLERLSINDFTLSNTAFLKKLTELESLTLSNCGLMDISFVTDMNKLTSLDLSNNYISDITPLSGLKYLRVLNLTYSVKSNSRNPFGGFEIGVMDTDTKKNGSLTDINPIRALIYLKELDISGQAVEDISVLGHLKDLRNVNLDSTNVTDITPLTRLPMLCNISLSADGIPQIDRDKLYSAIETGIAQ